MTSYRLNLLSVILSSWIESECTLSLVVICHSYIVKYQQAGEQGGRGQATGLNELDLSSASTRFFLL
jgi:hypothetical protein